MPDTNSDDQKSLESLRQRAEALLKINPKETPTLSTQDVQSLLYELSVHEMELEIQNEELRQAQVELSEARDRYVDLYEFAPVGYVTLDQKGQILEANLTATRLLEVERKQLIGTNLIQYLTFESQDDFSLHRQAVFSEEAKQTCEVSFSKTKDTIWVARLESIAVQTPTGSLCRTAIIDITEQNRAFELLRKLNVDLDHILADRTSELDQTIDQVRLLSEAVAHLGEGVLITDDELDWPGSKIRFVNEAMCQITGYSAAELMGQSPSILHGDDTDHEMLDRMRAELAANHTCCVELVNYRKDGTLYQAELFITAIYNAEGQRTNFVSINRDITERKRAEQALRASEERIRAIHTAVPDALITVDHEAQIVDVNASTEAMFGYSRGDLLGQALAILMPPPYRDECSEYFQRYLETGEARVIGIGREIHGQRKDGSVFPGDLSVSEVEHLNLFTGIIRDISDRRSLEKQVLETAEEESRRIGHELHDDIQQRLTGLGLTASTLANRLNRKSAPEAPIAARLAEGLQQANEQVHRLSHGLVPMEIDDGLCVALSKLAARVCQQYNLACHFASEASIDIMDSLLATHLYRIAQESINNAVKHGHAKQINISLTEVETALMLDILDNGRGFETEQHSEGGMGLRIMNYRAKLIGAKLNIVPGEHGGTLVRCVVLQGSAPKDKTPGRQQPP